MGEPVVLLKNDDDVDSFVDDEEGGDDYSDADGSYVTDFFNDDED